MLIRDLAEERQGWPRKRYIAAAAIAAAALIALAVLTSPQRSIAAYVACATIAAFLALRLVALGVALIARHAPKVRPMDGDRPVRDRAAGRAHRVGRSALGLGLAALVALTLIDANMRAELLARVRARRDAEFLFSRCAPRADTGAFRDFLERESPASRSARRR